MMLYPTNSADRRQQPCTTTIRSRRAHPRHVLDTAALNAYVPNNVGSKSHNELTWNHVVSVFTFFGLLMTALVSLCCWSHFQFIVERRRLAANTEFNSQHRRLAPGDKIKVSNKDKQVKDEPIHVTYTETVAVPQWYLDGEADILLTHLKGGGGVKFKLAGNSITWTPETSCKNCVNPKPAGDENAGKYFDKSKKTWTTPAEGQVIRKDCKDCGGAGKLYGEPATNGKTKEKEITATLDLKGWKKITDNRPHYVKENNGTGNCIIFFCVIQNKWHMCGPDGIYYRVNGTKCKDNLLPEAGWFSQKDKTKGEPANDDVCSIRVVNEDYLY